MNTQTPRRQSIGRRRTLAQEIRNSAGTYKRNVGDYPDRSQVLQINRLAIQLADVFELEGYGDVGQTIREAARDVIRSLSAR